MKMADLVKAAQKYDWENRGDWYSWSRVPDSQVARLLLGAKLAKEDDEQRQGIPVKPG